MNNPYNETNEIEKNNYFFEMAKDLESQIETIQKNKADIRVDFMRSSKGSNSDDVSPPKANKIKMNQIKKSNPAF